MFIGNVAFQRATLVDPQYKRFGKLWYGEYGCSMLLYGWRQGQAFSKPFSTVVEPPYLNGDILIETGEYEKDSVVKKSYLWCGFIWTESNEVGNPIYQIVLEVDPTMIMIHKQIKEYEECSQNAEEFKKKTGMFLKVKLTDR